MGEGSHVHAGPLWRKGENLEKDVGSKSFVVKFLVKKVEIYKFDKYEYSFTSSTFAIPAKAQCAGETVKRRAPT